MAHFAKLNESNIVTEVIVINNLELDPQNEEGSGLAWLEAWSGGYTNWKQTSYNGNFRKNYANIGFLYDPIRDAFIPPKPENVDGIEYILNEETCLWELPESEV
jgi:hypothetical protein